MKNHVKRNKSCVCPHCKQKFKKIGLKVHIWRAHTEAGKKFDPNAGYKTGRHSWSKGLKKENNESLRKTSETYKRKLQSGEIKPSQLGKKLSIEHKKKLSEIRKKYLVEHPDKVPYLLNHYSKGDSYPEKYFKEVFEKEHIDLKFHLQIGLYQLDFYNEDKMIYVEVDGEQHYKDPRIVESDKNRTVYLENLGWRGLRIRWAKFMKLSFIEKHKTILEIKALIESRIVDDRLLNELKAKLQLKSYLENTTPEQRREKRELMKFEKNKDKIEAIRNSDIDFSKHGWLSQVEKLIGKRHQKVAMFMKKYCPDIFEKAFRNDMSGEKDKIRNENKLKREKEQTEKLNQQILAVKNSGIDFQSRGWLEKVFKVTGIHHEYIRAFLKKYFPEISFVEFHSHNYTSR